jgi:hypothetical protein
LKAINNRIKKLIGKLTLRIISILIGLVNVFRKVAPVAGHPLRLV